MNNELEQRKEYLEFLALSKGQTVEEYLLDQNAEIFQAVTGDSLENYPDVIDYLKVVESFSLKAEKHDGRFLFVADVKDIAAVRGLKSPQAITTKLKDIAGVSTPAYGIYAIKPYGFVADKPRQNNLSWPLLDILKLTKNVGAKERSRSLAYFESLRLSNFLTTLNDMLDFDVLTAWETEKAQAKKDYDEAKAASKKQK